MSPTPWLDSCVLNRSPPKNSCVSMNLVSLTFAKLLGLSKKRAQPVMHCSGGCSDLGFPAWMDDDALVARPKHVLVRNVPRAWARVAKDFVTVLVGLGWSDF